MTGQLAMALPNPNEEDNGLRWVIYVEQEVRGREEMVLLLDEDGETRLFDNYDAAMAEKWEHPLSVIGTVNTLTPIVTREE